MSTDVIRIDAAKAAGQFSGAVAKARTLVEAATDEIVRDLVQVQAGQIIRDAMTDDVKALILSCGREGHYEVVPGPKESQVPPEQIIAVCVAAYLKGLSLSGQQFAVFPKRGGGASLYVKSNGYRHLFARSGHAADAPDVSVGHPQFVALATAGKTKDSGHDTGGKAVAYMSGEARVTWGRKKVYVAAMGEFRIGIPCYVSDQIDGLKAKAERRLLAKLWEKCTGIREADPETTDEVEPVTYEVVPEASAGRDWEAEKAAYLEEFRSLPACVAKTLYLSVMREESAEGIAAIMHEAATEKMDARHRAALDRAAEFKRQWLAAQEVGA